MRSIQVSTEVFAAIWKAQQEGEATENAILARLLKITPAKAPKTGKGGDWRHVSKPERVEPRHWSKD
jgi:hypothetical protein